MVLSAAPATTADPGATDARPDLDRFLALKGTNIEAIRALVDTLVGVEAGDELLVVGSVAEGLGNRKSDLDLVLITSRALVPGGEHTATAGSLVVDVRPLRRSELRELLRRLTDWAREGWTVSHAAEFSADERTLLHRLAHGRPAGDHRPAAPPLRPVTSDLARLKLQAARHSSRTIQVDLIGYREAADWPTMVFAAQELLGTAVDALAAVHGLTNPAAKWRSRLLDRLPPSWEDSLATRRLGLSAGERVWQLHRAPEVPEQAAAVRHAARVSSFARAVFAAAESELVYGQPSFELAGQPWCARAACQDPPLPFLDFDVDFAWTAEGVALARLNEFRPPILLSRGEFAGVLLFDGVSTGCEAAAAVGIAAEAEPRAVISALLAKLADADLLIPPDARFSLGRDSRRDNRRDNPRA